MVWIHTLTVTLKPFAYQHHNWAKSSWCVLYWLCVSINICKVIIKNSMFQDIKQKMDTHSHTHTINCIKKVCSSAHANSSIFWNYDCLCWSLMTLKIRYETGSDGRMSSESGEHKHCFHFNLYFHRLLNFTSMKNVFDSYLLLSFQLVAMQILQKMQGSPTPSLPKSC